MIHFSKEDGITVITISMNFKKINIKRVQLQDFTSNLKHDANISFLLKNEKFNNQRK